MRSERGIALMMAISAIMLISMIVLEFVFNSNVNYRIAMNEKERLQAYYLAESSLNLMKVELKLDKQLKSAIASSPIAQNFPLDLSQPMCKQFPFSTALIRGFFVGGQIPLMKGSEAQPEEAQEKGKSVTAFETESAQEFLTFEGDFDGACEDEQSKFNLNVFANLDPSQQSLSGVSQYDTYKMLLANFFKNERYKKLFDGIPPEKIDDVARNIADFADKNDVMNDFGYVSRGSEESIYKGDNVVKPKNSKFLSLEEIHFVEGVDDKWFMPLENMFTVYGENKVNVCSAEDDIIWALIISYASQNAGVPLINQKDPEVKKKLIDTVKFSCTGAQVAASKIAADLDLALGVGAVPTPAQNPDQQTPQATGGFANMITTESRYYSLKLTGQVGETMVNIKAVLDVKDTDPKKWKLLYYKVF